MQIFERTHHPTRYQIASICDSLNSLACRKDKKPLEPYNIQYWFKNARAALRRKVKCEKQTDQLTNGTVGAANSSNPTTSYTGSEFDLLNTFNSSTPGGMLQKNANKNKIKKEFDSAGDKQSSDNYDDAKYSNYEDDEDEIDDDLDDDYDEYNESYTDYLGENTLNNSAKGLHNTNHTNNNEEEADNEEILMLNIQNPASNQHSEEQFDQYNDDLDTIDDEDNQNYANNNNNNNQAYGNNNDSFDEETTPSNGKSMNGLALPGLSTAFSSSSAGNSNNNNNKHNNSISMSGMGSSGGSGSKAMSKHSLPGNSGNNNNSFSNNRRNRVFIDPISEVPILEHYFSIETYPDHYLIEKICENLNKGEYRFKFPKLESRNIQLWFKNHRAKLKRLKSTPSTTSSTQNSSNNLNNDENNRNNLLNDADCSSENIKNNSIND